jgi:hypothetical protein
MGRKSLFANARYTVADSYGGKTLAVSERSITNARHTIRNSDRS